MPGLGVGGATPFGMGSNHQTAHNHNFRDAVPFDPAKQTRVKCTYCGCWATRGKDCSQCKRPAPAAKVPRNNNVKVEPLSSIKRGGSVGGLQPSVSNISVTSSASSKQSLPTENAFHHKFREETTFDPSKQVKVKCQFCGCWAKKGAPCSLCKRVTPAR
eukprot:Tbor_TRINITY_DN5601_c1_g1::TRINITY_DN5601_c1_g1_i3::g.9437::m.9437